MTSLGHNEAIVRHNPSTEIQMYFNMPLMITSLSALPPLCMGNPLVNGGFPAQRSSNAEHWWLLQCSGSHETGCRNDLIHFLLDPSKIVEGSSARASFCVFRSITSCQQWSDYFLSFCSHSVIYWCGFMKPQSHVILAPVLFQSFENNGHNTTILYHENAVISYKILTVDTRISWGRDVGHILWIQTETFVLSSSLLCWIWYHHVTNIQYKFCSN